MKKRLDPYTNLDIFGTLELAKREIIAAIREVRGLLQAGRLRNRMKTFQEMKNYDK